MTDDRDRIDLDGELLSAWLSGDLDADRAENLERRLAAEPELAARLDLVHHTIVALRDLDTVEPPPGMSERLRERLAAERAQVPSLAAARVRRRSRWPVLGAAAAVVVLLAAVPVLTRALGGDGGGDAAQEAEFSLESAEGGADDDEMAEEDAAAAAPEPAAGGGPVITEDSMARREGDRVLTEASEANALLGLPVEQAREVAADYTATIRSASPLAQTGVEPAACLDQVTADREVAVPVRAEAFTVGTAARLTYVLVTASPGSRVLDVVEVRVVDAATCAAV
jgi:hypothetical protein